MPKHHDPNEMPVDEWRHRKRRFSPREDTPTTICYMSICRYADGCINKLAHPKRMPMSRCARYWPEEIRPQPTLSTYVVSLLESHPPKAVSQCGRKR